MLRGIPAFPDLSHSTTILNLSCSFQASNLPLHKSKLKRSKPNPVLCVVNLKQHSVQVLISETQDTSDPKFPQGIDIQPILVPRSKQFFLLALYDSQSNGLFPIGFARFPISELIRSNAYRMTMPLTRMVGEEEQGFCGEVTVEIGVVAHKLEDHIRLTIAQVQESTHDKFVFSFSFSFSDFELLFFCFVLGWIFDGKPWTVCQFKQGQG